MEKEIQKKINDAEEMYRANQSALEEGLETISDEKRQFLYELENTADQIRFISNKSSYDQTADPSAAYRLLAQVQEEAEHIIKKAQVELADQMEENRAMLYRQRNIYEIERDMLKKGMK